MSVAADFIPITRPFLGEREAEAAREVILSGWVTQGAQVAAFEREFAALVGAQHACAVSSCTAALHLALLAVGVAPGDEVITVSHSFIATANSIRHCGAVPVFVDIEPATYNMDPSLVASALSDRTRAILCVHQMGMPCDLRAILEVADRHSLPVIEDAACAVGSEILWDDRWEPIGKPHGHVACFSFHPRKLLTTGDGGMLTTTSEEYDRAFRLWRHQGMSVSDTVRHASSRVIFEEYPVLGYNYRMTDIQAAVGREQLKRLPNLLERHRALARRYREQLSDLGGLVLPEEPSWARSNWQSFCVRLPERCGQRRAMQSLLDAGIATRRGIMCAHREHPHLDARCVALTEAASGLPESESAQDHAVLLPLFHDMTVDQQDRVVRALKQITAR